MRRNMFGEAYCHDLADMLETVEDRGIVPDLDIHAEISVDEDNPGTWMAEVRFNEDGETVFWVEGYDSNHNLKKDLIELGIPRDSVSEL